MTHRTMSECSYHGATSHSSLTGTDSKSNWYSITNIYLLNDVNCVLLLTSFSFVANAFCVLDLHTENILAFRTSSQ